MEELIKKLKLYCEDGPIVGIDIDYSHLEVKGLTVVYTAYHGEEETGVVTSWNDSFIFVRYGKEKQSKATKRSQLRVAR